MIASVVLRKPGITPVLPQWNFGIVLEALSKPPYEPLQEASLNHLTLETVFLIALYFNPSSCERIRKNDPWYIPAVLNGNPDFGAPIKLPSKSAPILPQIHD